MLKEEIKLRDELGKKIQRINKNTADSTKSSFDVIKASLEKFEESLGTVDERLGKAAVGSMKKFEDSIVNSLKAGKLEFKDFSNYVIEQLIRIAIQEAILAPLKGTFTSFFSGFGDLFGGGKADGGAVSGGTPYMVGERGAEMFVPNSSGQIITNENIKQQGQPQSAPTVNFNISTVDAAGFDQLLASRKGLITSIINNAMNNQGKMGVV
jgi:lambda family phage tail tape measure protein